MRHMTTDARCDRCRLKPALCICAQLPRFVTRTHVTLLIHKMELQKSTNTGQLAAACLDNVTVVPFGYDLPDLPVQPWPSGHQPVVLFPVSSAKPVTAIAHCSVRPLSLIVLDANWRQANRLRKRFAADNVAFVCCPAGPPSVYRLRTEAHDTDLCTLEAVARALDALEGQGINVAMRRALEMFQDRLLWLRGTIDRDAVTGGVPVGVERHLPMTQARST